MAPAPAPAPAPRAPAGPGWSAHGAQGLDGEGHALLIEVGFPGVSAGYLRGVTSNVDLAVRLSGNYSYEGLLNPIVFGGRGEAELRVRLLELFGMHLGIHLGAGVFSYFPLNSLVLGLALPLGVGVGIPLGPRLAAAVGVDAPMWITFNSSGGFTVPILGNAALEYFLDKNLAATLRLRLGPALLPSGFRFGGPSVLDLNVYVGMEYKL